MSKHEDIKITTKFGQQVFYTQITGLTQDCMKEEDIAKILQMSLERQMYTLAQRIMDVGVHELYKLDQEPNSKEG